MSPTKAPVEETLTAPEAREADSELTAPTQDEIAALAYSYWEARGYQGGSPQEDWFRAESELARKKDL